jgi:ribosomal protein S18 acetylase RimI-like enzyme
LLEKAQTWAINRGDRQIGLQVFGNNQPALSLYQGLGFQPQSFFMLKYLP